MTEVTVVSVLYRYWRIVLPVKVVVLMKNIKFTKTKETC